MSKLSEQIAVFEEGLKKIECDYGEGKGSILDMLFKAGEEIKELQTLNAEMLKVAKKGLFLSKYAADSKLHNTEEFILELFELIKIFHPLAESVVAKVEKEG